jgi:chromate transport protein ChrA
MQIAGAADVGHSESNRQDPTTANNILLAGLCFQTASFIIFIALFGLFTIAVRKDSQVGPKFGDIKIFVLALMIASVLILLRLVFRLAETAQGVFGYLMVHEAFFGALEFAPVIIAAGLLAIFFPGRWLPRNSDTTIHQHDSSKEEVIV